jgi:hypothetical protein
MEDFYIPQADRIVETARTMFGKNFQRMKAGA